VKQEVYIAEATYVSLHGGKVFVRTIVYSEDRMELMIVF
jgi:hypothetical protein